jgi:hypothetical protein
MKKINIALMILSGLAVIGLTGCGGGSDNNETVVVNQEGPKFSSIAGTYQGSATGTSCNPVQQDIAVANVQFKIDPSDATTTQLTIDGVPAEGHNLTGNSFSYSVPTNIMGGQLGECGDAVLSGTCNYNGNSLNCDYKAGGQAAGTLNLNRS